MPGSLYEVFAGVLGRGSAMCLFGGTGATTPTITTTSPLTAVTYSEAMTPIELEYTGGGTPTWSVTAGALITGLSLNSSTGEITGTPSEVVTDKAVTIQVDNGAGTDSVAFTQTCALPSALSGAVMIIRAATYDESTGNWASDISPSTLVWGQGTASARPAEGSDSEGDLVEWGGDDYLIGNAAINALFNGLDNASVLGAADGWADASYYALNQHGLGNGFNCGMGTAGTGTFRAWERRVSTTSSIPAITSSSGTKAFGVTATRNAASQPVAWFGSTSSAGSTTTADAAYNANASPGWIGAADTGGGTPSFFWVGNWRFLIFFNKALSAGEMQAAQEYLEGKAFFSTTGVTLWA